MHGRRPLEQPGVDCPAREARVRARGDAPADGLHGRAVLRHTPLRDAQGGVGAFGTQNLRRLAARSGVLLTALLVALYVAARLWRLTAGRLWFDEPLPRPGP